MSEMIAYDKAELRGITRAFGAMDDEAVAQAKIKSNALASYSADQIKQTAYGRQKDAIGIRRVVDGVRVSKSSKIGEFSYGYASQRFSGGGTTQKLWPALEFGSSRFKQFPDYSGRYGRGSRGWFIYPTLRRIQPELVRQWEEGFSEILKKWDD